jgi:hypothetical protein
MPAATATPSAAGARPACRGFRDNPTVGPKKSHFSENSSMQTATISFDPFNSLSDEACHERIRAARAKLGNGPSSFATTTSAPTFISTPT